MSEHAPGAVATASAADAAGDWEAPTTLMAPTNQDAPVIPRKRDGSPLNSDRVPYLKTNVSTPKFKARSSHAYDQPPREEAERMAVKLCCDAISFIRDLPYHGEEKDYILKLLQSSMQPPLEVARNGLALLGNTGDGKSKTIISVFGLDLGTASNDGDSVTKVILEYRSCYPNQRTPFLIQVCILPDLQIWASIEDELREFREWQAANPELNQDNVDDDSSDAEDESDELHERPTRLTTRMKHLFPSKFLGTTDALVFLQKTDDSEFLRFMRDGLDKVSKALRGNEPLKSMVQKELSTPDAVMNFINPYISKGVVPFGEGEDYQCWPYSLIEKVVIAFHSSALSREGNVVIDSPGVGDTHKSNVDRAYTAVRNADKIMVVQKMGRSKIMASFFRILRYACRRRGPHNVFVVLTHSAQIHDTIHNIRPHFDKDEHSEFEAIQKRITSVLDGVEQLKQEEMDEQDLTARERLRAEIYKEEEVKAELERKSFDLFVKVNNRRITAGIHDELKGRKWWSPEFPKLMVFCIDNFEHEKHLNKSKGVPHVSFESTGVPALRRYISNFPVEGLWRISKHHIEQKWNSTFHSLEMTGTITKAQTKAQISELFISIHKSTMASIDEQHEILREHVEKLKKFLEEQEKAWAAEAVACHLEFIAKHKIRAATHESLMKKHGYTTRYKDNELDLNRKLHEIARDVVAEHLDDLMEVRIDEIFKNLIQTIHSVLQNTFNQIELGPQFDAAGFTGLVVTGLRIRKRDLERAYSDAQHEATTNILHIRDRVLDAQGDHAYWYIASRPAYDAAVKARKTGKSKTKFAARRKAFEKALRTRDGPFHRFHVNVFEDIMVALEEQRTNLTYKINAIFIDMQSEIDRACTRSDDESKEAKVFRESVVTYSREMKQEFELKVQPKLEEAIKMADEQHRQEVAAEQATLSKKQFW